MYGVDEFLGYMRVDGWVDRKEKVELESLFWQVFWENMPKEMRSRRHSLEFAIKVAKGIGLLWRNVGPIGPADMLEKYPEGMMYLTALLWFSKPIGNIFSLTILL